MWRKRQILSDTALWLQLRTLANSGASRDDWERSGSERKLSGSSRSQWGTALNGDNQSENYFQYNGRISDYLDSHGMKFEILPFYQKCWICFDWTIQPQYCVWRSIQSVKQTTRLQNGVSLQLFITWRCYAWLSLHFIKIWLDSFNSSLFLFCRRLLPALKQYRCKLKCKE